MFQKLRPADQSDATLAAAGTPSSFVQQNQPFTETSMIDNTQKPTTEVELDGLTKRADQTTASYSPRPATTTTGGFSSFPTARPAGFAPTSSSTPSYGSASSEDRKLVIGQGINISGEIEACPHLVVEGQVEASLKGANILDISETGVFFGSVEINEATIAGRFEGDIKVDGRLTVRSTGVIIGSLSYRELAVEAGASIEGKISPLDSKSATRSSSSSNRSSSSTAQVRKSPNMDNELPFATKAAS